MGTKDKKNLKCLDINTLYDLAMQKTTLEVKLSSLAHIEKCNLCKAALEGIIIHHKEGGLTKEDLEKNLEKNLQELLKKFSESSESRNRI